MLLFFIYQVYHLIIVGMNLKQAMAEDERRSRAEAIVAGEGSAAGAGSAGGAPVAAGPSAASASGADAE